MNRLKLEKEALEYSHNLPFVYETEIVRKIVRERVRLALIDVLESREKQIDDFKNQLEETHKANLALYTDFENKCKKIRELQNRCKNLKKENSSLKHNKETVAHLGNICIEVAKQMLEEAKELLKEWIVCHGGTRKFHSALQDKTEVFLKKIEE